MKKSICKYLLFFIVTVLISCPVLADETPQVPTSPSGWVEKGRKTFFYEDGKKVTGWKRITGKFYYFTDDGLQRNKIVGSSQKGLYYVDEDGVRITDKQIKMAVKFVMDKSVAVRSPKARLKECYRELCRYPYIRINGDHPSSDKISSYAAYMFTRKGGNCYRYASAYAYIAKVLGFDVRVCTGTVYLRVAGFSPHGWCEVKIDDVWRMVDCSMGRAHRNRNLFLITRSSCPFRLRCYNTFSMKMKDDEIIWK